MRGKFLTKCMKREWDMKDEGMLSYFFLHLTDPLLGARILESSKY